MPEPMDKGVYCRQTLRIKGMRVGMRKGVNLNRRIEEGEM